MENYTNEFEKQEALHALVRKARNLNIRRWGVAIAVIFLYFDMKTSRIVPSGVALGLVVVLAVSALAVRLIWDTALRCPFCGGRLLTSSKAFSLIPNHCPDCGEKLKY